MKGRFIEACVNGHQSAIEAEKGGARRVELCAALPEGGTTPSYGEIVMTVKSIGIPVNVIIRSRAGDFNYNSSEVDVMVEDIRICTKAGAHGIVIGALTPDGEVDMEACRRMIEAAEGKMSVTFHRAFDMAADPFRAAEQIIALGCNRILTSGQANSAYEGRELIGELVKRYGDRIIFMPGCGVKASNILEIEKVTGAVEFHMSGKGEIDSAMKFRNPKVSMGGEVKIDEYKKVLTSAEAIRAAVNA